MFHQVSPSFIITAANSVSQRDDIINNINPRNIKEGFIESSHFVTVQVNKYTLVRPGLYIRQETHYSDRLKSCYSTIEYFAVVLQSSHFTVQAQMYLCKYCGCVSEALLFK